MKTFECWWATYKGVDPDRVKKGDVRAAWQACAAEHQGRIDELLEAAKRASATLREIYGDHTQAPCADAAAHWLDAAIRHAEEGK